MTAPEPVPVAANGTIHWTPQRDDELGSGGGGGWVEVEQVVRHGRRVEVVRGVVDHMEILPQSHRTPRPLLQPLCQTTSKPAVVVIKAGNIKCADKQL